MFEASCYAKMPLSHKKAGVCNVLNYIEYLNIPAKIAIVIVGLFLFMQVIGEMLEFKGKIVPEFMKIRKYFIRKKNEKREMKQTLNDVKVVLEVDKQLLSDVKSLLSDVNIHYSSDNIGKRDSWIKWVNDRANIYDNSIGEIGEISKNLTNVTNALKNCTKMTEEMFVQSSRDRIIDFATKASSKDSMVSKEEFNRIFKIYDKYENFLKEHNMTNGEIDIAYRVIKESYEQHMKNHTFMEDVRGYDI